MALDLHQDAQEVIDAFRMTRHPEGGWYAETFRAAYAPGERAAVTAIYFLLRAGESSHWHKVDATEIWLWHAGSPLQLQLSTNGLRAETILLGADFAAGERPQAVVPLNVWQSARAVGAWSLASCVVAPGFTFDGFTLAPPNWSPMA